MKDNNKVRLNVDLTKEAMEKLEELRTRSKAATLIEVIRRALALYDLILTYKLNGSSIFIMSNGKQTKLEILL